uniref:Nudix hydrolase domain-containing protein n=1 Tax=Candidatus Kentrum sp. SD TaxID=2126332 RepID=A0A450YG92_9GAMM|nr:MAG: hypothetical protein BECKSD772F_GA0070984_100728 [Candidatus Kentron sp. SD]VFK40554.1 MAG: hypothetical protein BECKSD772E_GA0070983_100727 [Candidatus Kentron sp. SD]
MNMLGTVCISILVLLFGTPLFARDANEFFAAGMLPIAREDANSYVLLGKDRGRNHFETLSGKPEEVTSLAIGTGTKESAYETALRECVEETRGYWGRSFLANNSDEDKYINYNGFIFFKVEVPMVRLANFEKIGVPPNSKKWDVFREITEYAWVDVCDLISSDDNTVTSKAGKIISIHPALPAELEKANREGWFSGCDSFSGSVTH